LKRLRRWLAHSNGEWAKLQLIALPIFTGAAVKLAGFAILTVPESARPKYDPPCTPLLVFPLLLMSAVYG